MKLQHFGGQPATGRPDDKDWRCSRLSDFTPEQSDEVASIEISFSKWSRQGNFYDRRSLLMYLSCVASRGMLMRAALLLGGMTEPRLTPGDALGDLRCFVVLTAFQLSALFLFIPQGQTLLARGTGFLPILAFLI